jgi:50S ribosomal protein L16 3-hydroxylase
MTTKPTYIPAENQESVYENSNVSVIRKYWEKTASLLSGIEAQGFPKIGPDELFTAIVACVEDFCRGGRQRIRFYVDGHQVDILGGRNHEFLPKSGDGTFDGYHSRMVEHELTDYSLIIADWHQFERTLWERIVESVKALTDMVGISPSRMDTQAFVGTYKQTPFGVHMDPTSAFHFPIIGEKTMRFWEYSVGATSSDLDRSRDYAQFIDNSIAIKAVPGEIIYWPSHYWHVGESDGTFSVTWGLGYWIFDNLLRLAIERAVNVLENSIPAPEQASLVTLNNREILGKVDQMLGAVSSQRFRQCLIQAWLEHYSAYGFLKVPSLMNKVSFGSGSRVRKKPYFQILSVQVEPDLICVASAGYSCVLPAHPAIHVFIASLNKGKAVSIKELLNESSAPTVVNELVEFCSRSGSLILES